MTRSTHLAGQTQHHSDLRPSQMGRLSGIGRRGSSGANKYPAATLASIRSTLSNVGQPLEPGIRKSMEERFGYDFSVVRIHTDEPANRSADAIGANAYSFGSHLVFAKNRFAPRLEAGRRLLAHELVHVMQSGSFESDEGRLPGSLGVADAAAEREATEASSVALNAGATVHQGRAERRLQSPGLRLALQAREQARESECPTRFRAARSFRDLVTLLRAAEARLDACGHPSIEEHIHILRGIYYGTTWSADYAVEASPVRNLGFQVYTGSSTPADPRACLDCGLFDALRNSQDISDAGRRLDVGHTLIGLDARRTAIARGVRIPSQGATGLAISTWVGDLGGGAGMLALSRATNPRRGAVDFFRGTDFGGSINLEGDVAGYVVASGPGGPAGDAPTFAPGTNVADALEAYLATGSRTTGWNVRARAFLEAMGGIVDASNHLTNRAAVIAGLSGQIEGFACWYLVNRLRQQGTLTSARLRAAAAHIHGASGEMAEVFTDALEYAASHPGSAIAARGSGPAPSAPTTASGLCQTTLEALEAAGRAGRALEGARERLNRLGEEGEDLYRRAREGVGQWF